MLTGKLGKMVDIVRDNLFYHDLRGDCVREMIFVSLAFFWN